MTRHALLLTLAAFAVISCTARSAEQPIVSPTLSKTLQRCFTADPQLEMRAASFEDAEAFVAENEVRVPHLPRDLGVEVRSLGALTRAGTPSGAQVNLSASGFASPAVTIRFTPEVDCESPRTGDPAATGVDGAPVYLQELGTFTGFVAYFEEKNLFIELRISWRRDSAPVETERLAAMSAWIRALRQDSP